LQALVVRLGWWGPLMLIGVNILQIVIAPIPGYAVYLVAGFLYGYFWGGVWGSVGLLSGGMIAMWLARRFGRPLGIRIIGDEQLKHWEELIHSDSWLVWGVILLSPVGDTPYYLAGLSHVSFVKIAVLSIITRVPVAFLAAALGEGAFQLNWWQQLGLVAALVVPILLFVRYRDRLFHWLRARSAPV
jgi:uncharacterized membrane protein YdjX (TVP38/TMEM64 family)